MTYEQNVRRISEDMARIDEPASMKLYDRLLKNSVQVDAVLLAIEKKTERYKPFAVKSISEQAQAVRDCWNKIYPSPGWMVEEYLIEQGLIPPTEVSPEDKTEPWPDDQCECFEETSITENTDGSLTCFVCGKAIQPYNNPSGPNAMGPGH